MSQVPYASHFGILMYAMVCIRVNITNSVRFLSRYISKPETEKYINLKMISSYFCGTTYNRILYQTRLGVERVMEIHGFVDTDSARDHDHKIIYKWLCI
jgi:hypothetical protein